MLAADVREEPYHRRPVWVQRGRYLTGIRPSFRQSYAKHHRGSARRRSGDGWNTTVMASPRLPVTSFRAGVVAVALFFYVNPGLGAAHVRGRSGAFVCFWLFCLFDREDLFLRRGRIMRSCQRRYASSSSPSVPRSGFKKNPLRFRKGCLHCMRECVSSWHIRQLPRFSLRTAARADHESRLVPERRIIGLDGHADSVNFGVVVLV